MESFIFEKCEVGMCLFVHKFLLFNNSVPWQKLSVGENCPFFEKNKFVKLDRSYATINIMINNYTMI